MLPRGVESSYPAEGLSPQAAVWGMVDLQERNLERLIRTLKCGVKGWRGGSNPAAVLPRATPAAEIRISPTSFKPYHISSLLSSAPAPAPRFPNACVLPQLSALPQSAAIPIT